MTLEEFENLKDGDLVGSFVDGEIVYELFKGQLFLLTDEASYAFGSNWSIQLLRIDYEDFEILTWPDEQQIIETKLCDCQTHQLMWGGCICGGQ